MQSLYLLALLPPEPVFAQAWALKQEVHQLTGSRNAVRLPPHITLLPPARHPASFEAACAAALAAFALGQSACPVQLEGFGWFGDRTLYVRVHSPALRALHARLLAWCAAHLPDVRPEARPFTPHLTLATRDLPPAQVPELRQLFAQRTFAAHFIGTELTLFRHDGQQWQARSTFALGG